MEAVSGTSVAKAIAALGRLLAILFLFHVATICLRHTVARPGHLHGGLVRQSKLQVQALVGVAEEAMFDEPTCPTIERMIARGQLRKAPRDAWGTPLTLECPSRYGKDPVDVSSAGPDKRPGTKDDINSWSL